MSLRTALMIAIFGAALVFALVWAFPGQLP